MKRNPFSNLLIISIFTFMILIIVEIFKAQLDYSKWFIETYGVVVTFTFIIGFAILCIIFYIVKDKWNNQGKK